MPPLLAALRASALSHEGEGGVSADAEALREQDNGLPKNVEAPHRTRPVRLRLNAALRPIKARQPRTTRGDGDAYRLYASASGESHRYAGRDTHARRAENLRHDPRAATIAGVIALVVCASVAATIVAINPGPMRSRTWIM